MSNETTGWVCRVCRTFTFAPPSEFAAALDSQCSFRCPCCGAQLWLSNFVQSASDVELRFYNMRYGPKAAAPEPPMEDNILRRAGAPTVGDKPVEYSLDAIARLAADLRSIKTQIRHLNLQQQALIDQAMAYFTDYPPRERDAVLRHLHRITEPEEEAKKES